MSTSDVNNHTPLHSIAYPEWPAALGDARIHLYETDNLSTQSRANIIAKFRTRHPEAHEPVSTKSQRQHIQSLKETKFSSVRLTLQLG